jgi:hypothetical protein
MKKAICAVAVVMVLCFAGQAMAAGGEKTPKLKKKALSIVITEKAGGWYCECDCFPEEPPTEFNDLAEQVCHCNCSLGGSGPNGLPLIERTEEKMFQFGRPKKLKSSKNTPLSWR